MLNTPNIYNLLLEDHQRFRVLLRRIESSLESGWEKPISELAHGITIHEMFEQRIFYVLAYEKLGVDDARVASASEEHDKVQLLLKLLHEARPESSTPRKRQLLADLRE